ncbi:DNA replication factor Cdt1 [Daktulosphaira vitifoliae]|uniref:DNA replication factor Cdt1 n=1 Tax=Daktulosphaira vitifoliae TaxID=58002 RepID=UPI0021AA94A5|nr:DNA replication factor Cdt1 [Daktulosphaira vitifoliae]XP_050527572.1 DNA replication factor Cdt1 [Daktulosphaira vitifoliae]
METQQKTLDGFIKSRKRPANDDIIHKKGLIESNNFGIGKPSRKLLFEDDEIASLSAKKLKTQSEAVTSVFCDDKPNNVVTQEIENKIDVEVDRPTTPVQSPSTRVQLRKDLDLGEFRKIVRKKQNLKKLQDKLNNIEQCQNELLAAETKTETAKKHYLSSFKSVDLMVDTSPIKMGLSPVKRNNLKPTALFASPTQAMVSPRKMIAVVQIPQTKEYVSPRKLLDEVGTLLAMSPSKKYSSLADTKALPLPFKYRVLDELFKSMETMTSMMYSRKEKITFNKLKRGIQQMTRKNFTEEHLAQIKTVAPDFYTFSLVKSPKDKSSFELVIAPSYGSTKETNVDLIELTSHRKKVFSNSLLDIVKEHHREYLNKLIPPIVIDKEKITRWHPEFDVESVVDIVPSALPKIEVGKPKITSAKDLLDKSHTLFVQNNRLNRTLSTMVEEKKNVLEKKIVTEDAKNALNNALKGIPKSLLLKIQAKQAEKAKELMTRSVDQLDEDRMMSRLPDIARRIRTYFVQLQRNVLPYKKVIDQLKQSYPEAMTEDNWKSHLNLLQDKVPQWIVLKVLDGAEHIRIDKKIDFEDFVIKKLNSHFAN